MEREIQRHIEEIIDDLECPKHHLCCTSGLKNLCKARDIGLDSFVACLKEDPMEYFRSCLAAYIFVNASCGSTLQRD
jgi:hypothetical protein